MSIRGFVEKGQLGARNHKWPPGTSLIPVNLGRKFQSGSPQADTNMHKAWGWFLLCDLHHNARGWS